MRTTKSGQRRLFKIKLILRRGTLRRTRKIKRRMLKESLRGKLSYRLKGMGPWEEM